MTPEITAARALLERLPRAKLGFFPTPLYKLERLSDALGVELYIKRDDFTGMNLFGGNKVRKLEYLLGAAVRDGAEYAITYGATQSNHAMETAAACRRLGIKPILYLTAVVQPDEKSLRANLLLDRVLDGGAREGAERIGPPLRGYPHGRRERAGLRGLRGGRGRAGRTG